jgi:DNA-binding response OmpR family regulator
MMKEIVFVTQRRSGPDPRTQILESAGYKVTEFRNSLDCMEYLSQQTPQLLMLDILIEGRNGFEVCRQVRTLFSTELPIILCSDVYRGRLFREESANAGAQRFVLTPIDMDALLDDVRALTQAATAA